MLCNIHASVQSLEQNICVNRYCWFFFCLQWVSAGSSSYSSRSASTDPANYNWVRKSGAAVNSSERGSSNECTAMSKKHGSKEKKNIDVQCNNSIDQIKATKLKELSQEIWKFKKMRWRWETYRLRTMKQHSLNNALAQAELPQHDVGPCCSRSNIVCGM